MPGYYDPAIRAAERVRAVTALHWFGVIQVFFAAAVVFSAFFEFMPDSDFVRIILIIFFQVLLPFVAGVAAIAAATGVCQRRRWGLPLGFAALAASLFYFFWLWFGFFATLSHIGGPSMPMFPFRYVIYL